MSWGDGRCLWSFVSAVLVIGHCFVLRFEVGEMIGQEVLPEPLVERCMDVLHELTPNERDLIIMVVELVVALRDDDEGDALEGLEPEVSCMTSFFMPYAMLTLH